MKIKKQAKEIDFFKAYDRFLADSRTGRRLQPNGKRISKGTLANYEFTQKVIAEFCSCKKFGLRLRSGRWLNSRELMSERNYWKRFYKSFTDYLYDDREYFDNYTGQIIKNLKVFFNYLNKEKMMDIGQFHRNFYVRKEEIPIYPLSVKELKFLATDKQFEESLSRRMREVKDFFVFGCTVGLRFSDLSSLKLPNLHKTEQDQFLIVRSKKTDTETNIRLPLYCCSILAKYPRRRVRLLPSFNKANLNKYIKQLLEMAGIDHPVETFRTRRGQRFYFQLKKGIPLRLCDVASTHTMRRTAITSMLSQGVPEHIVRKISGHAAGSKDFFRYVSVSNTMQDNELKKYYEKMETA